MATTAAAGSAALAYPGPFGTAPTPGTGNSSLFAVPDVTLPSAQASPTAGQTVGDGGPSTSVLSGSGGAPLATTGSDAPLLATLSVLLMSLGGVLMVASRREDDADLG